MKRIAITICITHLFLLTLCSITQAQSKPSRVPFALVKQFKNSNIPPRKIVDVFNAISGAEGYNGEFYQEKYSDKRINQTIVYELYGSEGINGSILYDLVNDELIVVNISRPSDSELSDENPVIPFDEAAEHARNFLSKNYKHFSECNWELCPFEETPGDPLNDCYVFHLYEELDPEFGTQRERGVLFSIVKISGEIYAYAKPAFRPSIVATVPKITQIHAYEVAIRLAPWDTELYPLKFNRLYAGGDSGPRGLFYSFVQLDERGLGYANFITVDALTGEPGNVVMQSHFRGFSAPDKTVRKANQRFVPFVAPKPVSLESLDHKVVSNQITDLENLKGTLWAASAGLEAFGIKFDPKSQVLQNGNKRVPICTLGSVKRYDRWMIPLKRLANALKIPLKWDNRQKRATFGLKWKTPDPDEPTLILVDDPKQAKTYQQK